MDILGKTAKFMSKNHLILRVRQNQRFWHKFGCFSQNIQDKHTKLYIFEINKQFCIEWYAGHWCLHNLKSFSWNSMKMTSKSSEKKSGWYLYHRYMIDKRPTINEKKMTFWTTLFKVTKWCCQSPLDIRNPLMCDKCVCYWVYEWPTHTPKVTHIFLRILVRTIEERIWFQAASQQ